MGRNNPTAGGRVASGQDEQFENTGGMYDTPDDLEARYAEMQSMDEAKSLEIDSGNPDLNVPTAVNHALEFNKKNSAEFTKQTHPIQYPQEDAPISDQYGPNVGIDQSGNVEGPAKRLETMNREGNIAGGLNVYAPVGFKTPSISVKDAGNRYSDPFTKFLARGKQAGIDLNTRGDGTNKNFPSINMNGAAQAVDAEGFTPTRRALALEKAIIRDGSELGEKMHDQRKKETRKLLKDNVNENTLPVTMHGLNAVDIDPVTGRTKVKSRFGHLLSLVTEHVLDRAFSGELKAEREGAEFDIDMFDTDKEAAPVAQAQKLINPTEIMREVGAEVEKWWSAQLRDDGEDSPMARLDDREKADLGSMALQLYQHSNPNLVEKTTVEKTAAQKAKNAGRAGDKSTYNYTQTRNGELEFMSTRDERAQLFGIDNPVVTSRPAGARLKNDLNSKEYGRYKSLPSLGDVSVTEQSLNNQDRVSHLVVDKRAAILFAVTATSLMGPGVNQNDIFAKSFSLAQSDYDRIVLKFRLIDAPNMPELKDAPKAQIEEMAHEKAMQVTQAKKKKLGREMAAILENRGRALYLTHSMQPLTSRIHTNQTIMNDTTAKSVRFVLGSPNIKTVTKGTQSQEDMVQIFSLLLATGNVDLLLPEGRAEYMKKNSKMFMNWGEQLQAAISGSMQGRFLDRLSNAASSKMSLNDAAHPLNDGSAKERLSALPTMLEGNQDLKKFLLDKGADMPHAIEALIDFNQYMQAMQNNKPHMTQLNAYVDGKTNGVASQGNQIGSEQLAFHTGVLRHKDTIFAMDTVLVGTDDKGEPIMKPADIRDRMANFISHQIKANGVQPFGIVNPNDPALAPQFAEIVTQMATNRNLNKAISMIFPYGKELSGMKKEVKEHIITLMSEDASFGALVDGLEDTPYNLNVIVNTVHDNVTSSITDIFGNDTFKARGWMRNMALMHAAMDRQMTMISPTGHNMNLGGMKAQVGTEQKSDVHLKGRGDNLHENSTFLNQTSERKGSAASLKLGGTNANIGGHAYGRSAVIPVQSIDAATVNRTFSGKSWDRITKEDQFDDDPYVTQIYDAFKVDVGSFRATVEEVNNNWMNISLNEWSALEEAQKSFNDNMKDFHQKMVERSRINPNEQIDLREGEFDYIGELINTQLIGHTEDGKEIRAFTKLAQFVKSYTPMTSDFGGDTKMYNKYIREVTNELASDLRSPTVNGKRRFTAKKEVITHRTPNQIYAIVRGMRLASNIEKELPAFNKHIEVKRQSLRAKIAKQSKIWGASVLQYWAH
jgi:hypothetical protein